MNEVGPRLAMRAGLALRRANKYSILLLRGLLLIAVGALLIRAGSDAGVASLVLILAYTASNIALIFVPERWVRSLRFELVVGAADLLLVGLGPAASQPPPTLQETPAAPPTTSLAQPALAQLSETDLALARTLWRLKTQSEAWLSQSPNGSLRSWKQVLSQVANTAGLVVMPFQGNLSQLARLSRPCLIEVASSPTTPQPTLWVLAHGFSDRVLTYRGPEGLTSVPLQQLRHLWYGKLYLTLGQDKYQASVLRLGMQGARVQALQQVLKDLGYLTETLSGHFDPHTLQAVKGFQRDNLLEVDGYVGQQTLMMLLHFGGRDLEETT